MLVDPLAFEYTNIVKLVVVTLKALESHRPVSPAPLLILVTTLGAVGNVKPKLTVAVKLSRAVNVVSRVPVRVQFVRFVILAVPSVMSA